MNALELKAVTLQAGSFRVESVDLSVGADEYFTLMGRTGSGKSLLLKAICGLARIESGNIRLEGREISKLEPRFRDIGYVPQDGGLFPHLDVLSNIVFPLTVRGTKSRVAAKQVQELVELLGIDYLLKRATTSLSGGERQKVALARALARRPKLLILDEPVCALDEPARYEICTELIRVQKQFGVATLHVCHSRDEALQVANRIGVMQDGKLVETGTYQTLSTESAHPAVQRLFNNNNQGDKS